MGKTDGCDEARVTDSADVPTLNFYIVSVMEVKIIEKKKNKRTK